MGIGDLFALFFRFLLLAFLSIGGFPTVLPEMHRYVVEVHHWITSEQFTTAYTLAQLAPGPNATYLTLIGWQIAGWSGAFATTAAVLGPASTLTLVVGRLFARHPDAPLARAIRSGLIPLTIGLFMSSALIIAESANHNWRGYVLTFIAMGVVLRSSLNPLWLLAAGALIGMAGLV